jgi:hypothetical protein
MRQLLGDVRSAAAEPNDGYPRASQDSGGILA